MTTTWLLDACCLLNFCAAGCLRELLLAPREGVTPSYVVAQAVAAETLFVRRGGEGVDADTQDAIDLQPFVAEGLLRLEHPETSEELADFVRFAATLRRD